LQTLPDPGHQFGGHVKTTPPPRLAEGPQEGRMLVPLGARRTAGPDAGFGDLGELAFEGGPEGGELFQELGPELGIETRSSRHEKCTSSCIHNRQAIKAIPPLVGSKPEFTEALQKSPLSTCQASGGPQHLGALTLRSNLTYG
jgi:hypothetical protein